MGLSTKQVPNDHPLDWSQTLVELPKPAATERQQHNQQQQQSEALKCPRCGSTNTKFCYYNNYNKSQPRHFCKACKRHWTKGGTLRNVPVGGGRKNKRLKTANAATGTAVATPTIPIGGGISGMKYDNLAHSQQDCHITPIAALTTNQKKDISNSILYQALISSSSSVQHDSINAFNSKILVSNASPMLSLPKDHQSIQFSFSSLSPFDTNNPYSFPSSVLSHNNNAYELVHLESSTITTTTATATSIDIFPDSWQGQNTNTSSIMAEMPNFLNWNDMDPLVSADLNVSWDDIEIKP